jgi:hypothetical protein
VGWSGLEWAGEEWMEWVGEDWGQEGHPLLCQPPPHRRRPPPFPTTHLSDVNFRVDSSSRSRSTSACAVQNQAELI